MTVQQLKAEQRDCLQEIANVAMGQAGDVLARHVDSFVTLSIPRIKTLAAAELADSLAHFSADSTVYAASQVFAEASDKQLAGVLLLLLSGSAMAQLPGLLKTEQTSEFILADTCQRMASSCLGALSEQLAVTLCSEEVGIPAGDTFGAVCHSLGRDWQQSLVVEINYQLEGHDFNSDLVLLFPDQAIADLAERLDKLA